MEICYSDLVLITKELIPNVKKLKEYGADVVELLMDGNQWDEMELIFYPLAKELRNIDVGYTIHPPAWDINLTSENKAIREASFREYKKAIEFSSLINARHVVIHPGFCFAPQFDKELAKKRAKYYINELCKIAKPLNVTLAIENVGYGGASIFTKEEFERFLDDIDETAKYLIDVGHTQLNGWDIASTIYNVRNRLTALHLHDNDGERDIHLPIGEGIINWDSVFNMLRKEKIHCEIVLEYAAETDLQKLKEGKERVIYELSTSDKAGELIEHN